MLDFDISSGGIAPHALAETMASLDDYRAHLLHAANDEKFALPECSVALPNLINAFSIENGLVKFASRDRLKFIVVIGIGGSNLGAMAVYDAMFGRLDALRSRTPKMLFLDTVSSTALRDVEAALLRCSDPEELAVIIVSKSGTTTETIANADALLASLGGRFGDVRDRCIAITDEDSVLWHRAGDAKMHRYAIPKNVGGRYSVFSAVGLVPLALAGIDLEALANGASRAVRDCTAQGETNIALVSAVHTFLHACAGMEIHNTFTFDPDLEPMGKWYRQLMGESIGKEHDLDGDIVHAGIVPIVSVGSTDLHSMAQLYLGGPRNTFTNFVLRTAPKDDAVVPSDGACAGLVEHLDGKTFGSIVDAIVGGVRQAYDDAGLPYIVMTFPDRTEKTLGYYLQMRMLEMMYLAKLFHVNAFDQPAVESYKKVTRELLRAH